MELGIQTNNTVTFVWDMFELTFDILLGQDLKKKYSIDIFMNHDLKNAFLPLIAAITVKLKKK